MASYLDRVPKRRVNGQMTLAEMARWRGVNRHSNAPKTPEERDRWLRRHGYISSKQVSGEEQDHDI